MRRYELDWLRVLVFGILILYHVGMFFVPWGWHIKNDTLFPELQYPMSFVNQWRLPLLFVISGMGTAFAFRKRGAKQFIKERARRLLIPLLFGMFVIVPPQVYVERVVNGELSSGYLEFLGTSAFTTGTYPEGNFSWHHLWFLPYLFTFALLLTPLFTRIHRRPEFMTSIGQRIAANPYWLFLMVIPLYLCEALLEPFFPTTHNLVWDWFNFTSSLFLFAGGFILVKAGEGFWKAVDRLRYVTLSLGVVCFSLQVVIWNTLEDGVAVHFTEALLKVVNLWSWILCILAFGARYLNKPGKWLSYANEAVYPFYILHQSVTVLLAWGMYDMPGSLPLKFFLLSSGTFAICWVLYEGIIRRVKWLRPLFGLKPSVAAVEAVTLEPSARTS